MNAYLTILALLAWKYALSAYPIGIISGKMGRLIRIYVGTNWTVSQTLKLIPKETIFTAETISFSIDTSFTLFGTLKALFTFIS